MMITYTTANVLDDIKGRSDCHYHTIFSDPPYQLSTVWDIDRNTGRYVVRGKASDFMNKWEGLDHNFLEVYFQEAFRVLKYGGYALHYCVARQSAPLIYYAKLAGFETECQPLHWYFISNFPKGTDAGKAIDKRLGAEREVVGERSGALNNSPTSTAASFKKGECGYSGKFDLTAPATPMAQTFDGWKYGKASLKATSEKILVFRKPTKGKSVLDDLMACMDDPEISPACLNIEGGRVPTDPNDANHRGPGTQEYSKNYVKNTFGKGLGGARPIDNLQPSGRYPSDLFLDAGTAEMIDKQSGELTSGKMKAGPNSGTSGNNYKAPNGQYGKMDKSYLQETPGDSGGASRINHIIGYEYEQHEQYIYCPKVSDSERNAGLGGFEAKEMPHSTGMKCANCGLYILSGTGKSCKCLSKQEERQISKNPHPTLKPIALNIKIATLFKLPDACEQRVYVPFCGTGSEGIGAYKAGITRLDMVDIDPENIALAKARMAYWKDKSPDHKPTKAKDPGDLPGQMELF